MSQKSLFLTGVAMVLLYCVLATLADAATRVVAQSFAPAQLFFFSGAVGMALSYMANRASPYSPTLRTKAPGLIALRSALFVVSCALYFYAFKWLMFAEVFIFIALVPIFAACLSGPMLGETVNSRSWIALALSVFGTGVMYPEGLTSITLAHVCALFGAFTGAASMVLARLIYRFDRNTLLQVFYPNLALCAVMAVFLPFVYKPMDAAHAGLILGYGVVLFAARWVLVFALAKLPAYVATPLMNVQFIVMLVVGVVMFGEVPSAQIIAGALIVMAAGGALIWDQLRQIALNRQDVEKLAAPKTA